MKTLTEMIQERFAPNDVNNDLQYNSTYKYAEYMKYNKGVERKDMPQIWGKFSLADVMFYLGSNFYMYKREVPLKDLRPTQNILHDDKINDMLKNWDVTKEEDIFFITGRDNYLVDSHHTWSCLMERYGVNHRVTIFYVDLPILGLLTRLNALDSTGNADK